MCSSDLYMQKLVAQVNRLENQRAAVHEAEIEPLKVKLAAANDKLEAATAKIFDLQEQLKDRQACIWKLKPEAQRECSKLFAKRKEQKRKNPIGLRLQDLKNRSKRESKKKKVANKKKANQ